MAEQLRLVEHDQVGGEELPPEPAAAVRMDGLGADRLRVGDDHGGLHAEPMQSGVFGDRGQITGAARLDQDVIRAGVVTADLRERHDELSRRATTDAARRESDLDAR